MKRARLLLIFTALAAVVLLTIPLSCGTEKPSKKELVLVFVPGAAASPARFNWLAERLELAGWEEQYMFSYDCREATIEEISEDLDNFILEEVQPTLDERLVLIGHSMGGIVSRYWVEELGGDELTIGVVLLGTPNRGTPSADALKEMYQHDYLDKALYNGRPLNQGERYLIERLISAMRREMGEKAILQLTTDSLVIEELNCDPLPEGVYYLTAAGNTEGGAFLTIYQLLTRLRNSLGFPLKTPHDGLVPLEDAKIPPELGESKEVVIPANHLEMLKHLSTHKSIARFLWDIEG